MKNNDLSSISKSFNLDQNDTQILQIIISSQKAFSMTKLSKLSKIPRTTVYRIAENLVDEGLAEWVIDDRGKKVRSVNHENLDILIEKKKKELKSFENSIEVLKQKISNSVSKLPLTQVRYYNGKDGMKQLIWNTLQARAEILGYSMYVRSKIVGRKFIKKYLSEFRKRKLTDKVIISRDFKKKVNNHSFKHNYKKVTRIIEDEDFYVSGDTYIYNDIYAVNFWNENEIIGVEIQNPEIARVQRSIFYQLWKKAKPIGNK